jgi:prophage DNA circulation protein
VASSSAISARTIAAASDATAMTKLAALLPGQFSRYAGGANAGYVGNNGSPYSADTTFRSLSVDASGQRERITAAAAAVTTTIGELGVSTSYSDVGVAIAGLVDALLAACADPADALRLLLDLLTFDPGTAATIAPLGKAVLVAYRRAVAAALGKATSLYQPSSYDDAVATLSVVTSALHDQATIAADAGDDASFKALRSLRAEVVTDLRARGAQLARVRAFTIPAPVPATSLSQRFYRDPRRADQLLRESGARHPLFMPTSFTALAA